MGTGIDIDVNREVSKETEKVLRRIVKLQPEEFIGVCKILGVKFYTQENVWVESEENEQVLAADRCRTNNNEDESSDSTDSGATTGYFKVIVRPAEDMIGDMIQAIEQLNRIQRKNLNRLLKPATKGR